MEVSTNVPSSEIPFLILANQDSANPPEGRLLQVYPPEGAEDDTSVDIVAIHGLGTTTPLTWEYRPKTGTVVNWLSDPNMLPDIVPSARISTSSWNAEYYKDASVARIDSVAEILLSNLQSQRDKNDTHSRPLIFVASCFGGLIVTRALEIANIHDSQYRELLVANSGVVFLGSPLQGTKASKAAQWRAMLGGILNKGSSQTLLQDLDGSTRALRDTSEKFVTMVTTPPMQTMTICFWESKKTEVLRAVLPARTLALRNRVKMILVEQDSACLFGRPKKMLDAPHSMMNKFSGPSDANFGLVSNAIEKMVKKAKIIAVSQREAHHLHNEYFMVPRRPNTLFTGRERELGKLRQALCPSFSTMAHTVAPKIYVIYGMGGAGKSEVALKFAHENRSEFWGIFWIDGRSKSSITNGFATIARTCGHHDESLEGTISLLQNTSHSWLLILDNADNKDLDLAPFLPAGKNGSILITTRLPECADHQNVGKDGYERLNQQTAINLLLKACGIELSSGSAHEDNARAVVDLLGCHALAIIQAGAAIRYGICGLTEYKDKFGSQRQTLLQCFPTQGSSTYGGVHATFEVSAAYLEARNDPVAKDAVELLKLYAFMHFEDFPEAAFEEAWKNSRDEAVVSSRLLPDGGGDINYLDPWHVSHLPTFIRRKDLHNIDLIIPQARSLLASLSLVTFDSAKGTTRMHPVSHFWSRDRLQKPEESMNAGLNGLSVLSLSINNPFAVDVDPLSSQLQPHIEFFAHCLKEWDCLKSNFHFQQSIFRLGWVMYCLSYESGLFALLQMIPIQADESWIRTELGQEIQMLHSLAIHDFRAANEAVTLLEQVNEARVQTLAAEDSRCLDSQHSLAKAYLMIGETTKAINLLESVVEIEAKTLRADHPHRLASQHELASAYLEVDQTSKAIDLLESVVEIQAKTLRAEHPDLLTSQHELARAYLKVDQTSKAIGLLESVVEIQAKTLRAEHSGRLTSQHNLAVAYLKVDKTSKAIGLLESVVEMRAKTLKADHPDRVSSIHALAQCHRRAGNYQRALQLARSIETVARNRPGQELGDWNTNLIGFILDDMEMQNDD